MSNKRNRQSVRKSVEGNETDNLRQFIGRGNNLDVSALKKKHPELLEGMALRFVNNEDGRVQNRLNNGWEVVMIPNHSVQGVWSASKDDGEGSKTESSMVSRPVGRGQTVNALDSILMAKPMEQFLKEERAAVRHYTKVTEDAIEGGQLPAGVSSDLEVMDRGSKISKSATIE